jgi:hypothetical protein
MPSFAIPDNALENWDAFMSSALSHAETQITVTQEYIAFFQNIKAKELENVGRTLTFSSSLVLMLGWGMLITLSVLLGGGALGYFGAIGGSRSILH